MTEDIEAFRFNKAVARIYELTNATSNFASKTQWQESEPDAAALREALEITIQLVCPMMPHFAEEAWAILGHDNMLTTSTWPVADGALTADDEITMAIQVNGKRRGEITCPAGSDPKEVEALSLAVETVQKAMDGKAARKVIVVPDRIVNIVV